MGKKVKKKKVSYIVGTTLDGPVYCEHDIVEAPNVDHRNDDVRKKEELKKCKKSVPHIHRKC